MIQILLISANVRFLVALAVLITQGLALLFCQGLLCFHSTILYYFSTLLTIFISFFSSEWIRIHSFALTRQKRAFFDETNILETYQPRSRTHGHLFQPDPPTPGPVVKFGDDPNTPEHSKNEKAAFNAMRDAWIRIHSFALTRQKRAFFDETNILETYQPRSRTHGHLFQPDPPTPGPVVKFDDDPNTPEHSKNEKAAFNAMRDAHYENMFEYAARVAKEAEEADRQALEAQKSRLSQNDAALPQGEPLYEDLPTNPPVNGPPSLNNGTKLELPPSLMEKSEDSSRDGKGKSPKQKSSKITK
uniref:Uncharacterized protein n=1 Tax=Panagrolaimus sp. ES5 TaxID=591445 RepID=A0AC34FE36_9BILA